MTDYDPVLEPHMQNLLNACFRCKKAPYETNAAHWHYCNDCVRVCNVCGELKVLWAFNFNMQSAEYKRWHEAKAYGLMNASGHNDTCAQCERNAVEAIFFKSNPKATGVPLNALEIMLNATVRKQTTTEPPATLPEGQLDLPTD